MAPGATGRDAGAGEGDRPVGLEGVHGVPYVAGSDVDHRTRVVSPGPGQNAERARCPVVPAPGRAARGGPVGVEDDGQVHEDDVVGGEGEVVHHDRPRQVHGLLPEHLSRCGGPVVGQVRRPEAVPEEVQLSGEGAGLGWAVMGVVSAPSKVKAPRVARSGVTS